MGSKHDRPHDNEARAPRDNVLWMLVALVYIAGTGHNFFSDQHATAAEMGALRARVSALEVVASAETTTAQRKPNRRRRRVQRAGDGGADMARTVNIYTRRLTRSDGEPQRGRRVQTSQQCDDIVALQSRIAEVTAQCCDAPAGQCDEGTPATCTAGCADSLLPFFIDCKQILGPQRSMFHDVVRECQEATVARADESLAMQLALTCTDESTVADCVPMCNEELHGDLLLANIDGEDSKYSE